MFAAVATSCGGSRKAAEEGGCADGRPGPAVTKGELRGRESEDAPHPYLPGRSLLRRRSGRRR